MLATDAARANPRQRGIRPARPCGAAPALRQSLRHLVVDEP